MLAGCATGPERVIVNAPWEERSARLQLLENWRASGKLALRNGSESETASLVWNQQGRHSELQLSGPMGLSATRIVSDGLTLEVSRGDDLQVLDISSPEAILSSTGWDLPLQALPYWLRGLPAPSPVAGAMQFDQSLLLSMEQDGWQVQFKDYRRFGEFSLPTRMTIERGATSAKLLIRDWSPQPS